MQWVVTSLESMCPNYVRGCGENTRVTPVRDGLGILRFSVFFHTKDKTAISPLCPQLKRGQAQLKNRTFNAEKPPKKAVFPRNMNYNAYFDTKVSWCNFCTTRLVLVHLKVRVATNSLVSANSCELFALFAFFSGALWTTTSSISMTYSRLPFVSSATLPPYFFIAIWFYIYGS